MAKGKIFALQIFNFGPSPLQFLDPPLPPPPPRQIQVTALAKGMCTCPIPILDAQQYTHFNSMQHIDHSTKS